MKLLNTIFLFAALSVSSAINAQTSISATEATVVIDGQTTREQLAQLSNDLKAQQIDFRYRPEFDGMRKLTKLSFTVLANDGAVTGEGVHNSLQNTDAKVTFYINKTTGAYTSHAEGDTYRK